jgi:DHA1 family inner membrane transport protein
VPLPHPADPDRPDGGAKGREGAILLTLAALQFVSTVDFMIVMPLGPQLLDAFGIDARQFSWIVSAYTLAAGAAGFAAAPLLDRVGHKAAYLVLSLGLLLATAACGMATGYPWLLAARCATGAFGGVHGGLSLAILADIFPVERRGRATGVLMSSFAVASVAGVPIGIALGTRYGWQAPFFVLAAVGLPLVAIAAWTMPPLASHLGGTPRHPLRQLLEMLTIPSHRRALALIALLMFGAFSVIPYISTFYVANVGVTEPQLPAIFIAGGLLTLVATPIVGRLVDRYGPLPVYRRVVPLSALMILVLTHLPAVGIVGAASVTAVLMATNAGRMVTAMSLITSSIDPARRGSFMSTNASVQHVASGIGTLCGGMIVRGGAGEPLRHFGWVGILAAAATVGSLWIAGRLQAFRAHDEAVA